MARASIYTLLSLDRYARIMGINPAHFNGVQNIDLADGSTKMPLDNAQNDVWVQHSWQNADQVSREELASEIRKAEEDVSAFLGYLPAPDWIENEQYEFSYYHRRDAQILSYDTRFHARGVILRNHYFIESGIRGVSLIGNVRIDYQDIDMDGFDEIAVVTLAVADTTIPLSEIKVYVENKDAERTYELRDPLSATLVGGVYTAIFRTWQMINPDLYDNLPDDGGGATHIDITDASNLLGSVDVYHEYNDNTQYGAVISYIENGAYMTSSGSFYMADYGSHYVIPFVGSYDSATGLWSKDTCNSYGDRVDLSYYSGYKDPREKPRIACDFLNNDFAKAIAYIATARLERVFYANNNATALASRLREDMTTRSSEGSRWLVDDVLSSPFGTRIGEVNAYRILKRYHPRRIGSAIL